MTSISELPFDEIWLHDFEFVARPGERPDVVCLAARELRSGRTIRLWRDELGAQPPYRTDDRVLFVSFVANAEMACHLSLGWPVPKNVLDLNPAFRNLTNGRSTPEGKGLIGAAALLRAGRHRRQAQGRDARADHAGLAVHAGRAGADPEILHVRCGRAGARSAADFAGDRSSRRRALSRRIRRRVCR